jgi:hypothetical protein
MEIEKVRSATTVLIQHHGERPNHSGLSGIILAKQDIHARRELDCLISKTSIVLNANGSYIHGSSPKITKRFMSLLAP